MIFVPSGQSYDLRGAGGSPILSMAGGTRASAVEALHKMLVERHSDLKWELEGSSFEGGWQYGEEV